MTIINQIHEVYQYKYKHILKEKFGDITEKNDGYLEALNRVYSYGAYLKEKPLIILINEVTYQSLLRNIKKIYKEFGYRYFSESTGYTSYFLSHYMGKYSQIIIDSKTEDFRVYFANVVCRLKRRI